MPEKQHKREIPEAVLSVSDALQRAGFEAYLVGGCVRDLFLGLEPDDWDIATNATPNEVQKLFPHTYYENTFGTVGIVNEKAEGARLKTVEVTTYRTEGAYSDSRRPDSVTFAKTIEEDLARRDFTINAIAYDPKGHKSFDPVRDKGHIVDPYGGLKDIKTGSIKAVGNPNDRFGEDALRMLRAVRFASRFGFVISRETGEAMEKNAKNIRNISMERIGEEFLKIVESPRPKLGIELMHDLGLLKHTIPELEEGIGIEQNQAHTYEVFEHMVRSTQAAADKKWPLELRLASLFHDIGKPRTREMDRKKNDWSFHGHEVLGAKMTREILERLKFPVKTVRVVTLLVRWHMFFSDTEQITLSAVRRMLARVGEEHIWDLMNLRIADRKGMGRPKEEPYRFRKYKSMVEEVLRDPVSPKMLKLNGSRLMEISRETSGPRIGWLLHALLEEVLEDPRKNTEEYLENRALELSKLSDKELHSMGEVGKEKKDEKEKEEVKKIRSRHFVE